MYGTGRKAVGKNDCGRIMIARFAVEQAVPVDRGVSVVNGGHEPLSSIYRLGYTTQ